MTFFNLDARQLYAIVAMILLTVTVFVIGAVIGSASATTNMAFAVWHLQNNQTCAGNPNNFTSITCSTYLPFYQNTTGEDP